jgi:uroporphyrinogen decarboxylase
VVKRMQSSRMNSRERVLATLRHQPVDRIPCYEEFYDLEAERKFAPQYAGMQSRGTMPATREATPEKKMALLQFMDCDIAEVASGRLRTRVLHDDAREMVFAYENGAVWRLDRATSQTMAVSLPLESRRDPAAIPMPDPDDPGRYRGVGETARYFREHGYFTLAKVHGVFSGAWYLFRPLDRLFVDMIDAPGYVHAIVDLIGDYNYRTARHLLECGVDCILMGDDMGSSGGLLFSPKAYVEFFHGWHRRMADLCHEHGGYLQIHSHGNINGIMPQLMATGVDILNPVGPTDGMNLEELLKQYGQQAVFAGGISKRIGEMTREELARHLEEVISLGKRYGSYVFRSEGGIPPGMSLEMFRFYMDHSRRLRVMAGDDGP